MINDSLNTFLMSDTHNVTSPQPTQSNLSNMKLIFDETVWSLTITQSSKKILNSSTKSSNTNQYFQDFLLSAYFWHFVQLKFCLIHLLKDMARLTRIYVSKYYLIVIKDFVYSEMLLSRSIKPNKYFLWSRNKE